MAKPKAKEQCEDDMETKFANITQQGLNTFQPLKSQLTNQPLPGSRFCWREGIHLQFCQLDMASPSYTKAASDIAQELSIKGHKRC